MMSGAKHRMRSKKMRNQPSNVTFSSPGGPGTEMNGQGRSQSDQQEAGGWARGHHKGGNVYSQDLPKCITACTFAKARAAEVNAMLKAVTKTTGSCYVFGALPRHMRRRAMSHNVKRLPRRLRDGAKKMMDKSLKAGQKEKKEQSKAKSRKARRRHGNILLEFNRRQRKNIWLETHIWHAKRFHMVKKWGYCLGERPTYKCYRASYRAMSSHCLMQDLSYLCCVELQGQEEQLLSALSRLTSKDAGPTFAAVQCLSGRRQGSVVLYRANMYPAQPLGSVLFLWRPRIEGCTRRQLWIWAHPTLKQDLLPELRVVCRCSEAVLCSPSLELPVPEPVSAPELPESHDQEQMSVRKRKRGEGHTGNQPAKKLLGDCTQSPSTPLTWKSDLTGIVINDITMEIVRYRLIGPLSHSVLSETLSPAPDCEMKSILDEKPSSSWWPGYMGVDSNMSLHRQQADLFQLLKGVYSTTEIPAGTVLGLTVDDPRLTLPSKRRRATPDLQQAAGVDEERLRELTLRGVPEGLCQSALWERAVRDNVTHNKISEQELNRMRSSLLVPGSRLHPTPLEGRVPILLVHQSGKRVGHEMASWGAGWDLLLPKGWGMAFWVPLVYRGVRIGGLRMAQKHSQHMGVPHFPHDFPDCPAGTRFQEEQEAELRASFTRRPPAKRANYIKHGCLTPFRCPWQQLTEEWEMIVREGSSDLEQADGVTLHSPPPPPRDFTVLRNWKAMRQLSIWCRPTTSKGQRSLHTPRSEPLCCASVASLWDSHSLSLVWVRLTLMAKGRPELHAAVCVPTAEDLSQLKKDPHYTGPQEPLHKDHFKEQIKKNRKNRHKTKAAHKAKESGSAPGLTTAGFDTDSDLKKNIDTSSTPKDATSHPVLASTQGSSSSPPAPAEKLLHGLWPDPLPSVTSHCSRVTLGWATQGDFSLSAGCGEALGFVSVTGLVHTMLKQPAEQRGLVLLRNPSSLQYRFAKINVEV
ncbi:ribonucleases P/MRP protein subunit POP1 isoform X2 [Denticeps clupeoides]|uniref:ribonucleases P/MRP protein subunit POP1 isoform X2 n=1 Tax=Denticeps clupeoides TaxID=299321 RepID=UPI0010A4DE1C|nr:ribonucleases P/MRP protein subunit POP1 isoform X2 [Denticeps clupeoides]